VSERHHTVDIREFVERARRAELLGNDPRNRGRTIHGGQNADVVAGGDPAIGAHDAFECRCLVRRERRGIAAVAADRAIRLTWNKSEVVGVHVLTGLDPAARRPDDLAELPNRLALLDTTHRNLVTARDGLAGGDCTSLDRFACRDVAHRDDDRIIRMETHDRGGQGGTRHQ
jgi:hypothetical protein